MHLSRPLRFEGEAFCLEPRTLIANAIAQRFSDTSLSSFLTALGCHAARRPSDLGCKGVWSFRIVGFRLFEAWGLRLRVEGFAFRFSRPRSVLGFGGGGDEASGVRPRRFAEAVLASTLSCDDWENGECNLGGSPLPVPALYPRLPCCPFPYPSLVVKCR